MPKIFTKSDIMKIKEKIYEVRGTKVMLDFDLAPYFGYETRRFNERISRNIEKFPENSVFKITKSEQNSVSRSQIATSKSKIATSNLGGNRKPSFAFTIEAISSLQNYLNNRVF